VAVIGHVSQVINWSLTGEQLKLTETVCRLPSVTLLHATQRVELFGNIFAPSNSPGTYTLCIKILGKKFE